MKNINKTMKPNNDNKILIEIYQPMKGLPSVEVHFSEDTVWLNQQQISTLFQTERSVITKHINNIYKTSELKKESTCAKIAQVQTEGQREIRRKIFFYNLDMIVSIGYRVKFKTPSSNLSYGVTQ